MVDGHYGAGAHVDMLSSVHQAVRRIGKKLGLNDEDIQFLLESDAEHQFEIKLGQRTISDFAHLSVAQHAEKAISRQYTKNSGNSFESAKKQAGAARRFQAYRVQHKNVLGPYKGGIRFHPEVDLNEVRALAVLMSLKTAAVGLPLGGGKGGVAVNPKMLTRMELEELARTYVKSLVSHIGPDKDIPAPDVNTDAEIMDWMVDEYEKLTGDVTKSAFTGKSLGKGGSLGREAATGRGGVTVLRETLKLTGRVGSELTMAIQGMGNVGSYFGRIAQREQTEWRLVAASDSSGGIFRKKGLKASAIDDFKALDGKLIDYKAPGSKTITNQELMTTEVDVLALAALGSVITNTNVRQVRAGIILELANGAVDDEAYEYLSKKGTIVIPDILANAGGVIVSYLEWLQNKTGEKWSEAKVNRILDSYLIEATNNIYNYSQATGISLKEAAYETAIKRIIKKRKEPAHGQKSETDPTKSLAKSRDCQTATGQNIAT